MEGELEDPEIVQMIKELLDTRIRPVSMSCCQPFFLLLLLFFPDGSVILASRWFKMMGVTLSSAGLLMAWSS